MKNTKTPMPSIIRRDIIEISLTVASVAGLTLLTLGIFSLHLWWLEFILAIIAGALLGIKPLLKRGHVGIVGIVLVVILLILSYVPSNKYLQYSALGVASLYIGYTGVELYRSVRRGRALANIFGDVSTITYKNKLEEKRPAYLPAGYTEVLVQKKKTEYEKDSIKIFFQIKGTESLFTLTESNGPLGSNLDIKLEKLSNVSVKEVPVTVQNRVDEIAERRSKNKMDAMWNYKGQSYHLFSNSLTWNETQKVIESLIT